MIVRDILQILLYLKFKKIISYFFLDLFIISFCASDFHVIFFVDVNGQFAHCWVI